MTTEYTQTSARDIAFGRFYRVALDGALIAPSAPPKDYADARALAGVWARSVGAVDIRAYDASKRGRIVQSWRNGIETRPFS